MKSAGYVIETRHSSGKNACPSGADKTRRCECRLSYRENA